MERKNSSRVGQVKVFVRAFAMRVAKSTNSWCRSPGTADSRSGVNVPGFPPPVPAT